MNNPWLDKIDWYVRNNKGLGRYYVSFRVDGKSKFVVGFRG